MQAGRLSLTKAGNFSGIANIPLIGPRHSLQKNPGYRIFLDEAFMPSIVDLDRKESVNKGFFAIRVSSLRLPGSVASQA